MRHRRRHGGDAGHAEEHGAQPHLVGDDVGVHRERRPQQPDRQVEREERGDVHAPGPMVGVAVEQMGELRDGRDRDEVEEQLQPTDVPVGIGLGAKGHPLDHVRGKGDGVLRRQPVADCKHHAQDIGVRHAVRFDEVWAETTLVEDRGDEAGEGFRRDFAFLFDDVHVYAEAFPAKGLIWVLV